MDDVMADPNALLKQFDSVSNSQRALVAEFGRQRSRLTQLMRWYDHQQSARSSELSRQSEQVNKETRRQINYRPKIAIRERARLRHLLDDDINQLLSTKNSKPPSFEFRTGANEKKRKVYGCLLPKFKGPVATRSCDSRLETTPDSVLTRSDYKKHIEKHRSSINKFIESPLRQRTRMNSIIDKCLDDFEQCFGDGYDHFLQTSEPNRNAQILAQQNTNHNTTKLH